MPSPSPRHVLVLAYFFPPLGGAGVQRTLKFVKYLSELGWRATVITTRSTSYEARDESLLDELPPGTRVIRAPDPPFARWAVMGFDHFGLDTLRALAAWPDPAGLWAPGALFAALRVARRDRPDVVLSTSAPYSAHLVGLAISRITQIPWVADFRDEWATNPTAEKQPWWSRRLSSRSERAIARRTDRVVTAADYFDIDGAPRGSPLRTTITNGVDEDDLALAPSVPGPAAGVFRLSHVGTLYGRQDAAPVLEALQRLVDRGDLVREHIELRVVGNAWLPEAAIPSSTDVSRTGYVGHSHAMAEMRAATVLLLYVHAGSLAPSGKLYEYLVSGRPILCVTEPENLAWKLVEAWGAGVCASPDDGAAIEDAIMDLHRRWTRGELRVEPSVRKHALARYSRRALAGELDAVLDAAVRGAQPA